MRFMQTAMAREVPSCRRCRILLWQWALRLFAAPYSLPSRTPKETVRYPGDTE